jgi:Zn-dependent peptidase ImmA (M78 family)/transcriptional regulator with XRE-family HTH domain
MPQSPPAVVTPSSLRWARESLGLTIEEAASRVRVVSVKKLRAAEMGADYLTMRQAEAVAHTYERPLAALFLPEPPVEEPPEAQFRRLPGAPGLPWPPEMVSLARRIRSRQQSAVDLYEALDEEAPWRSVDLHFVDDPDAMGARVRERLGISVQAQKGWRDRSGYAPLREWVDAIEQLGVLVMQDGSLPIDEMRGFASTDPDVPAIVINTKDDPRARAFTAVHELGHLIQTAATETWCNRFASSVLMPHAPFEITFGDTRGSLLGRVDETALDFGVTAFACAVRVATLGLARRDDIDVVIESIRARSAAREAGGGGGDYYRTTVGRLGPSYIQLVFSALDTQALTYPAAAGLLGVKVNNFETLRDLLSARAAG